MWIMLMPCILYAMHSICHEFIHVGQVLHPRDVDMRLNLAVWKVNRGLLHDCYTFDIRELDAEGRGLQLLYPHLCDRFGMAGGNFIFGQYVEERVACNSNYALDLHGQYDCPENVYRAFKQAYMDALARPFWYTNRVDYDMGANSGDMVLRVLADGKWDGADGVIMSSSGYRQSCRRILALCAQEDRHVLDGLEDLAISKETEFPVSTPTWS